MLEGLLLFVAFNLVAFSFGIWAIVELVKE